MFPYARTSTRFLCQLLLAAIAVMFLSQPEAARAQTPAPGANDNAASAVRNVQTPAGSSTSSNANANTSTNLNANTNTNTNANANTNVNRNGNTNTNANVTSNANVGASPPGRGEASFTTRWFGIEGPAWMVVLIVILLIAFVVVVLKYVPGVRELLGPKAASATGWIILVLVFLLLVFFIGRWFGHTNYETDAREVPPAATPTPTPTPPTTTPTTTGGGPNNGPNNDIGRQPAAASAAAPAAPVQQTPTPVPTPYDITVGEVRRADKAPKDGEPVVAGLGEEIVVKVNNLKEEMDRQDKVKEPAAGRLSATKLTLFLDDMEMKTLYPEAVDLQRDEVRFKLSRNDETKKVWNDLLAKPAAPTRPTKVSVGPEGKPAWPAADQLAQNFRIQVYDPFRLKLYAVMFLLALVFFVWLARTGDIIRDSQPPEPLKGERKPYSLGRAQVAWWTFIIFGSFLFLWLVTNDYNTITSSSLVLLGIGTGTALGAAMVDSNKREGANKDLRTLKPRQMQLAEETKALKGQVDAAEAKRVAVPPTITPEETASLSGWRTELAAKSAELEQLNVEVADVESSRSKPVSEGFISDVLSDVNGVTIHRLQIAVWTITLGVIFIRSVWTNLQMPEFDEIVLALMGISGATYLGFKIPERQTEAEPQPAPPAAPPPPPPPPPPGGGQAHANEQANANEQAGDAGHGGVGGAAGNAGVAAGDANAGAGNAGAGAVNAGAVGDNAGAVGDNAGAADNQGQAGAQPGAGVGGVVGDVGGAGDGAGEAPLDNPDAADGDAGAEEAGGDLGTIIADDGQDAVQGDGIDR